MPVNSGSQRGIALLIFVIVLAFSAIAYAVSNFNVEQLRYQEAQTTRSSLQRAKQALLDFAVTYEDGNPGEFGFLPCPDVGDDAITEGGSHSVCGVGRENTMGLFPWTSLETGILKSGTGQCLWYAVSGEYKNAAVTQVEMLNEDTNGALRLYDHNGNIKLGAAAQDRVVAVILDPSKVLPGQNRSYNSSSQCGLDYAVVEYLEGNGTLDNSSLSGGALVVDEFLERGVDSDQRSPPFNDQLVTITRTELWDAIVSRTDFSTAPDSKIRQLTEALAMCIAAYGNSAGNRRLPRPSAVDFSGADYRIDANYDDTMAVSYLGRFPFVVDDSDAALGGTYAPNDAEPDLFRKGFCNALPVAGGPPVPPVSLNPDASPVPAGYTTWKNWKDHFFYAVSTLYAPSSDDDTGLPGCDGTNCIVAGGTEYAAVVLYAGSRTGSQLRNEPVAGDPDTKNTIANYIEVNNPIGNGTGDYTPTANDIAFCITDTDPLTVVSCP